MTPEALVALLRRIAPGRDADLDVASSDVVVMWLDAGQPPWTEAQVRARFKLQILKCRGKRLLTDQDTGGPRKRHIERPAKRVW